VVTLTTLAMALFVMDSSELTTELCQYLIIGVQKLVIVTEH